MKHILVNYNFTPDWVKDEDYLIYDRSDSKDYLKDFDQNRIFYTPNIGQVDYDKLGYLVDNYDNLPDVFLWGKTNLFKYISEPEWELVRDSNHFTPLLTQNHKIYMDPLGPVNYYSGGMYYERNNSWYTGTLSWHVPSFSEFARYLNIKSPDYIPFAPGGNYILTKEVVHKYSRDFYQRMRDLLPYCENPAEAHMCERAYYLIWGL